MYGTYELGQKEQSLDISPTSDSYLGVIVYTSEEDDSPYGSYGNISDTSRVLELTAPICTSTEKAAEIAENIYNSISGKQYAPFSAGNAALPPIYGLGDSVTINNSTYTIAKQTLKLDSMNVCDISAPSEEDIDNEIAYVSQTDRKTARQLATQKADYSSKFEITSQAISTEVTERTKTSCHYGTCVTATATKAKVVTCSDFKLYKGAMIAVKFTNANTANSPTLNVNSTGAKSIYAYGKVLTSTSSYNWVAGSTVYFVYNGSQWELTDSSTLSKLDVLSNTVEEYNSALTQTARSIEVNVNHVYENVQHDYCVNGDFSDKFNSWDVNDTSAVYYAATDDSGWATLDRTSQSSAHLYQKITIPSGAQGAFKIRFRALAASAYSPEKAIIRCVFAGANKYTTTGELSEVNTFEFDFDVSSAGTKYLHLYNYVANTKVWITGVEVLGYISGYAEAKLTILSDSITSLVSATTGDGENSLQSQITQNADSISSCVKENDLESSVVQYYDKIILNFNNNSSVIKINSTNITVKNDDYMVMKLDKDGHHLYDEGTYLGWIGAKSKAGDSSVKGLGITIQDAQYLALAQTTSVGKATSFFLYTKANGFYDDEGLYIFCDIYANNNQLSYVKLNTVDIANITVQGTTTYTGTISASKNLIVKDGLITGTN